MITLPYADAINNCKSILIAAAPDMPPDIWWMTGLVIFILALAALIDALTGIVPDIMIFFGLSALTGMHGWYGSWPMAALHLRQAIEAGIVIWGVNHAWYLKLKQDALGMGDAKWTMLAVACFGFAPLIVAWGVGATLASLYIGGARLARHKIAQIHFAPFLMMGLTVGIYWLRF